MTDKYDGYELTPNSQTAPVKTLIDIDEPLDSKTYRFGIRTIEIEQTDDKRGSSFIFKINGKRRFIKGANWVPIDSFPASATASRYREILRLAKDANINMLRVWGGGVYESPNFYQACDELGIMIWQDFMFACGHYPDDDPQWLTNVQQELQHAFHSLRNHTSIVLWCGNNECGMNIPTDKNYPGKNLYEGFLKDLCQSDPTRPYRITSPYDGEDPNSPDQGDMHFGAWVESAIANEPENFSEYVTQRCTGRFHSEIHTMGSPPLRSLQRFMSEDDINDKYGPAWEFHTRNNPYDQCLQTYIQRMAAFYLAYYGPPTPTRLHTDMLAYQQHEIITQHTEHHRRAMFDCGGVLFWSMNEPWPCICGSLVDYYLAQKAGYFAAKRRFKPTIISIQRQPDQTSVWICNDLLEGFDAKVDFAAESFDGRQSIKRSAEFYINPNSANRVFDISPQDISTLDPTQCFLTASLTRAGKQIDRTITPINLPQQWNLPEASLTASTNQLTNDTIELTVSTDAFAQAVTIEPLGNYNTPQKLGA